MQIDSSSFLRRSHRFFTELKAQRYPNAASLARSWNCSENTAQRVIYRLRDEYLVPIEYSATDRGYYLTNPDYELPHTLPAGKDELTALILARELVTVLDAPELSQHLDNLWNQFTAHNSVIARELTPLISRFSSDSTAVGDLADRGLLSYLSAAHVGEHVAISYKSPWRHLTPKRYEGRIERLHCSDGSLYLLLREDSGREVILNASFIRDFAILTTPLPEIHRTPVPVDQRQRTAHWLEGFGVWAGSKPQSVTVKIAPPAAEFYAAQRWHAEQEDHFEGDVLVRTFPGIVSPELVRRILSIAGFVVALEPPELRDQVLTEARKVVERLG